MRNLLLVTLATASLSLVLTGCFGKDDSAEPEGDTDTDSDSDTDSDTDADADTDADTDVGNCELGSGWPCSCDPAVGCTDGSDCIGIQGFGDGSLGYCAPVCDKGDHSSCPGTDFSAQPYCLLSDGAGSFWCGLVCKQASECPSDQDCWDTGHGFGICYPA